VIFEERAVEDRAATIESGHYSVKDVHYAIITPAGTKDRIEKIASEWLKDLEEAVRQERFPQTWLDAYKAAYKSWCETREVPENGIPVGSWPGISPAQHKMLLDLNLRTVEQVAEATEEAISRMGMGGRALKAKAQAYLDASEDVGKTSAELESLRQKVDELLARDKEREEQLKTLEAENKALKKTSETK
jgi:DNA repair exonuclease SbcCD ATPase subunit